MDKNKKTLRKKKKEQKKSIQVKSELGFKAADTVKTIPIEVQDVLEAKQKILKVAIELFAEFGFDGVSIRDIANKSGMNLSLVSYYFGGKEALYKEIIRSEAEKIRIFIRSNNAKIKLDKFEASDFKRIMMQMLEEFINERLQNINVVKIIKRESVSGFPYSLEIHQEIMHESSQVFSALIQHGQKKGFISKDVNSYTYLMLLSQSLEGYLVCSSHPQSEVHKCYILTNEEQKRKFLKLVELLFVEGVLI